MILTKGNISFRRLTIDDIELVRNWRNSQQINQYMAFRDHITPEMQVAWFHSINNMNNLYFIIEYKNEKVGVFNGKDINWEQGTMETGIFIAEEKYINTELPLLAVLSFGEIGLNIFNMTSYAHMLKSNKRAIRYNKLLGFELCDGQEELENQLYVLNRERFFQRTKLLKKALFKIMGVTETILVFEREDMKSGLKDFFMKQVTPSMIGEVVETMDSVILRFRTM